MDTLSHKTWSLDQFAFVKFLLARELERREAGVDYDINELALQHKLTEAQLADILEGWPSYIAQYKDA